MHWETVSSALSSTKTAVFSFSIHVWNHHKKAVVTVALLAFARYYFKKRRAQNKWKRWGVDKVGKDVLVVHCFNRGFTLPCLSPFGMKLETFLRMNGIKYKYDSTDLFGPKSKSPWISLNGEHIGDSQLIIDMLSKKYDTMLNSHLTPSEIAIGTAFRVMADEHIFWAAVMYAHYKTKENKIIQTFKASWLMKLIISHYATKIMKDRCIKQGLGVHSDEEAIHLIKKDFDAISDFLGDKKYLLGDRPCEADCAVFASIGSFLYGLEDSPFHNYIKGERCKNLVPYYHRIKEEFWPDWNQLTNYNQ